MRRFTRIATTSVGIIAAAAISLPLAASAASAEELAPAPTTAITVVDPAPIADAPTLVGTPLPASVTITGAPDTWVQYAPMPMQLATTGFSAGNWVNVWVTNPDGTRESQDGHLTKKEGTPAAFANFMHGKGTYKVQISMGAWPEEQWSQIIEVQVR